MADLNPLDWLFGPSQDKIAAAKADLERNTRLGKPSLASNEDLAHQAALLLLLHQDAKARNPLLGDMPLNVGPATPAPASTDQGGVWADAEAEKKNRGNLVAPVLQNWGLVPKSK